MRTASLLLPLLALLSLAGCGNVEECANGAGGRVLSVTSLPEQNCPSYGGCIVTGRIGDASVLLPILAADAPSRDLGLLIFNGLLKYDKNARLVGDLAERWELSEDKLRLRFHLRKGVQWHDGRPLTCRDVEYTYRLYIDPETPTPWAADFHKVKSFRCLDDHVAEVSYEKPYAPALDSWTEAVLPHHLLEGEHITKCTLQRSPVGTGPYQFERWKTGEKIILKANPHYFEGRPYIGRVLIRVVPDPATMFLLLKAGEIDRMDLTPLQYSRMTDTDWFRSHFRKYKSLHFGYTYLGYNLHDPKFKDKRVRQAITMAINRERIVQGVLLGHGVVAHTPYKPDTIWHNPRVRKFPYHPEQAKRLLAEAGWTAVNGDGILHKDGVPFEFTIITNQGNELRRNAAVLIQHDLKEIGIQVHIRVIEWAALLKNFLHKRDFEACLLGWRVGIDPNQIDVWDSSRTCERCLNFVGYANPEVDRLLQLGASTFDVQERKRYYDKFQEILADDQPCTFLWVQEDLPIVNGRFCGIEPAPLGIDYNFNHWYVPKPMQKSHLRP
ncbi:MAG: peptide-binding protein [Desulfomonile tiedjei]|nr:peptide-binding protein [Desulfomonile tiedjei]